RLQKFVGLGRVFKSHIVGMLELVSQIVGVIFALIRLKCLPLGGDAFGRRPGPAGHELLEKLLRVLVGVGNVFFGKDDVGAARWVDAVFVELLFLLLGGLDEGVIVAPILVVVGSRGGSVDLGDDGFLDVLLLLGVR